MVASGESATTASPRFHLPENAVLNRLEMGDGCGVRTFWLPAEEPRANLLILTGRADFLEKWAESFRLLHEIGLNLASFDWRGQGASDREVPNRAGHIATFGRWLEDTDAIASWANDSFDNDLPCFVLGHSMGGHLLARWLSDPARTGHPFRQRLRGAIFSSPFLDLPIAAPVRWLVCLLASICKDTDYIMGEGPYGKKDQGPSRQSKLTSSIEQFEDEGRWIAQDPRLATGGGTWGWLRAFFQSRKILNAATPQDFAIPMLLLAGGQEKVVSLKAIRRFRQKMSGMTYQEFPAAAHELLREAEPISSAVYAAILNFLTEHGVAGLD